MNARSLRLASYNIHGCVGRDGVFAPERIARVIDEIGADVIALQEVVAQAEPEELPTSARHLLSRAFVGDNAWAPTFKGNRHFFGNLLLSRWPIESHTILDLTIRRREPRNAIDARIAAPFGPLQVIATHLGLKTAERRQQAAALHRRIDETTERWPIVLAGDLNVWNPFSRVLRMVGTALPSPRPYKATYPTPRPFLALDRILLRATGAGVTIRRHATDAARIASDHFPLVAEITLDYGANARMFSSSTA